MQTARKKSLMEAGLHKYVISSQSTQSLSKRKVFFLVNSSTIDIDHYSYLNVYTLCTVFRILSSVISLCLSLRFLYIITSRTVLLIFRSLPGSQICTWVLRCQARAREVGVMSLCVRTVEEARRPCFLLFFFSY